MNSKVKKLFYNINEVAELLNEPASTLRYWEKEFGMPKPKTSSRGVRSYKAEDIEILKTIQYLLRGRKLTLDGAKEVLKNNKRQRVIDNATIVEKLLSIREEILEMKRAILVHFPDSDTEEDEEPINPPIQ